MRLWGQLHLSACLGHVQQSISITWTSTLEFGLNRERGSAHATLLRPPERHSCEVVIAYNWTRYWLILHAFDVVVIAGFISSAG